MALISRREYGVLLIFSMMCLVFVMIITSSPAFCSQGQNALGPRIRELAPDFVLKDLDGEKVRLADYRGKVVLLNFSTTWCPHCKKMPPYLNELLRKYGDNGLEIINVDIQEPLKKVRSFAAKYDIKYRVLLDEKAAAAKAYSIRGVPSLILVDKDGTIVCRQCRSLGPLLENLLPAS